MPGSEAEPCVQSALRLEDTQLWLQTSRSFELVTPSSNLPPPPHLGCSHPWDILPFSFSYFSPWAIFNWPLPRTPHWVVYLRVWRLWDLPTWSPSPWFSIAAQPGLNTNWVTRKGCLNYNTMLQVDLCCCHSEKWSEVPYIHPFFKLSPHPDLHASCCMFLLTPTSLPSPSSQNSDSILLSAPPPPYSPSWDSSTPLPPPLPTSPQTSPPAPPSDWVSPSHTCSVCLLQEPPKPTTQFPLWEVAGWEGIIQAQAPFSMSDLSKTEVRLGNFSANPAKFTKEFEYLSPMTSPREIFILSFLRIPIWERETIFGPRHRSIGMT